MAVNFTELVIKAPFPFVKGFLLGYMNGRDENYDYFFHRKSGIKRKTLGEMVKEIFAMDCYTDLCLPDSVAPDFEKALLNVDPAIGISIEEKRRIKSANFTFSFKIFSPESANVCKQLFSTIPANVEIENFEPREIKECKTPGVQEYAPVHPYIYQGEGTANGAFEGVMNFYLTIKRSELSGSILCSEINLEF